MPRKIIPKPCRCNCGGTTKGGDWLPGHDQKLRAAIEEKAGGLISLINTTLWGIRKPMKGSCPGERIAQTGLCGLAELKREVGKLCAYAS